MPATLSALVHARTLHTPRAAFAPALALSVAACLLTITGCKEPPPPEAPAPPPPPSHYAGDQAGLHDLWMDIVTSARRDDRDRVHELMTAMVLTDDDLKDLFGAELAAYFKPRYEPMIGRVVHAGSLELVANVLDRKYDDVDVFQLRPDNPDISLRAALGALKKPVPVYSVRVKKKGEALGLRYDFFVYRGDAKTGRWATANKIGNFIAPPNDVTNTPTGFVMPKDPTGMATKPVPLDKPTGKPDAGPPK